MAQIYDTGGRLKHRFPIILVPMVSSPDGTVVRGGGGIPSSILPNKYVITPGAVVLAMMSRFGMADLFE